MDATAGKSERKMARAVSDRTGEKLVYLFEDLSEAEKKAGSWDEVRSLLGGKGANLAEMVRLGLPVPPGFIVTTEACRAYLCGDGILPDGLWDQVLIALAGLESRTGKQFGGLESPLLVSCRSGAKFSMPGMMDTVLNIGLNDAVTERLGQLSGDERFALDAYRRLIQMYGTVVLGVGHEIFEKPLSERRRLRGVQNDSDLRPEDLRALATEFKELTLLHAHRPFPGDPLEQLRLALEAVFLSWRGRRAHDYREAAHIPHDLGTAVSIVAMVFGNLGLDSGTGVATTRNVSTGQDELEGDFLVNAQGEDVVAGTRATLPIAELARLMPEAHAQLGRISSVLERHFREVQDIEFTIEHGRLWMLQTRDAKRTAQAAIRIAVEMVKGQLITPRQAVHRVRSEHVDYFLHPQFETAALERARAEGLLIATGLNVSPGAAIGQLVFDADTAERWAKEENRKVIMVRPETRPDDVHGLLAAQGVLTTRGGRTSHAALVARQFGKPAVVGAVGLQVDLDKRELSSRGGKVFREGDVLSLDGGTGEVFAGEVQTHVPDLSDPNLLELLRWADEIRTLEVWANADYPRDAQRARALGAQGIGLCRTEHMFFEPDRLPLVQQMIMASTARGREESLAKLLPLQREDFLGLFRAMDGLPVTIRLLDPPLHEFLPNHDNLLREVVELETRLGLADPTAQGQRATLAQKRRLLQTVEGLREQNPMLGLRGVRLGIHLPELVRMQVRAIFEAACAHLRANGQVQPKIMIPLAATSAELRLEREIVEQEARKVMEEQGCSVPYQFGTMIEIPRAALVADQLAEYAEFFSFGTNDLTQTTFGISRDDAETGFLAEYLQLGILADNPFVTLDQRGVGALMQTAIGLGRSRRPDLEIGICGEHGGDPRTIAFCQRIGVDYVSCSPLRVPLARLAAAHAALEGKGSS